MTIRLDNERLTKAQVCAILHIGYSTLGRWMRDGKIKFERDTTVTKFNCAVFFRLADLAEWMPCVTDSVTHPPAPNLGAHPTLGELPPTSPPVPNLGTRPSRGDSPLHPAAGDSPAHPKRNAAPSPVGHYEDEPIKEFGDDPIKNAKAWAVGTIKDSAGNATFGKELIDGSIVEKRSLIHDHPGLASCESMQPDRDTASHMDPALVGKIGPSGNDAYLNSLEYQRDHWGLSQESYDRLTANARRARQSEQHRKQVVDVAAIREAFRHGYSR
jgi:hypothetical protein